MNNVRESTSHIDYVMAAIAGLVSLVIVFSVPFPMSLVPVVGIFAVTGYVILPLMKKRQERLFEEARLPERLHYSSVKSE